MVIITYNVMPANSPATTQPYVVYIIYHPTGQAKIIQLLLYNNLLHDTIYL